MKMMFYKVSSGLKTEGESFSIDLAEIDIWSNLIRMSSILESFEFIHNKKNWEYIYREAQMAPKEGL
jgi:hypothetical protein